MRFTSSTASSLVGKLPSEVLLEIFRFVYLGEVNYDFGHLRWNWTYNPNHDKSNQPALIEMPFPYSLAFVCTRWRDIMSLVPHFWTRVITFADSPFFSASFISNHLSWSGHMTIHDIAATRTYTRQGKSSNSRNLKACPSPHSSLSIVFCVTYAPSLRRIATDFADGSPCLNKLHLDATKSEEHYDDYLGPYMKFLSFPKLLWLSLDGRNL